MILTCDDFQPVPPSPRNEKLQTDRVVELIAMGCVVERDPDMCVDCVGVKHGEQMTCWDFVDELSLYSDTHWQDRLGEYKWALE